MSERPINEHAEEWAVQYCRRWYPNAMIATIAGTDPELNREFYIANTKRRHVVAYTQSPSTHKRYYIACLDC